MLQLNCNWTSKELRTVKGSRLQGIKWRSLSEMHDVWLTLSKHHALHYRYVWHVSYVYLDCALLLGMSSHFKLLFFIQYNLFNMAEDWLSLKPWLQWSKLLQYKISLYRLACHYTAIYWNLIWLCVLIISNKWHPYVHIRLTNDGILYITYTAYKLY